MDSTLITLDPEMKMRMAVGRNQSMEPTANWDTPELAGAGALRIGVVALTNAGTPNVFDDIARSALS